VSETETYGHSDRHRKNGAFTLSVTLPILHKSCVQIFKAATKFQRKFLLKKIDLLKKLLNLP